jgi:hypothetical protein
MLEMKKNCEECQTQLPASSEDAMICSFECTFCSRCASDVHQGICPNCEGPLMKRPARYRGESCSISAIAQAQAYAKQQAG